MTHLEQFHGDWNYPTSIRFGIGRIAELPDACRKLHMSNPLLVTDRSLAELSMIQDAAQSCRTSGLGCAVYSDVKSNPVEQNVSNGVDVFKAGKHDGVIAMGGGSGLDAGKAIALMVGQNRPIWDFEDKSDWYTRVDEDGMAPVVAVPTTSGTGSEVGRASVITDELNHTKKIIFHPKMMPAIVIADPALTAGLPPHLTAWVGMDALSHNLEAICSPLYHPLAHGIALHGIKLIKDWLPAAVEDGRDLEARAHMLVASTMGATAFQKGLGAMHSLSHPVGAVLDTHHGLTNAVVMPYVLEFNREAIELVITDVARYLNLPNPSFHAVMEWVLDLRKRIGIPHTLAMIGVSDSHVDRLAEMAAADPSAGANPVPVTAGNMSALYRRCIHGELES